MAGAAWVASLSIPVQAASPLPLKLLILGDSLSAEYGLARGQGWVALMEQRLKTQKSPVVNIINASISGETTSGGLARLPALLKQHRPTHVVIELGANDAFRGIPIANIKRHLTNMVQLAQNAGASVLIIGIQVPPNYGPLYTKQFAAIFTDVARDDKTALVPFMLKGVADVPDARSLFQADGIHPLAKAHPTILENIWPALQPWLLKRAQ